MAVVSGWNTMLSYETQAFMSQGPWMVDVTGNWLGKLREKGIEFLLEGSQLKGILQHVTLS